VYFGVLGVPEASRRGRPCGAQASRAAASTQARELRAPKRAQQVKLCVLLFLRNFMVFMLFPGVVGCILVFWGCQKPPEEDGPAGPKPAGLPQAPKPGSYVPPSVRNR
jgi:hypothetical protein